MSQSTCITTIHTLIVFLTLKFPKSKYTIQQPASNPHLTFKIHTLIVCTHKKLCQLKIQLFFHKVGFCDFHSQCIA